MGLRLIKCPKCQRNTLDNVANCPHCGAPLSGSNIPVNPNIAVNPDIPVNQEEKLKLSKAIRLILIAVVILGIISMFSKTFPVPLFFFIILYIFIFSFRKNIRKK